ncbi:hypothetical protein [Streptomyces sp. NPDC056480]|uniref:hypothetical protein n=1 Tax=Streptomyces sp. NPDC056480 TaxID=3345833 RepID=UPI0036D01E75
MDIRVFKGLNAEWALVCAEPDSGEQVRGWLEQAGVLRRGQELRSWRSCSAGSACGTGSWAVRTATGGCGFLAEASGEGAEARLAALSQVLEH